MLVRKPRRLFCFSFCSYPWLAAPLNHQAERWRIYHSKKYLFASSTPDLDSTRKTVSANTIQIFHRTLFPLLPSTWRFLPRLTLFSFTRCYTLFAKQISYPEHHRDNPVSPHCTELKRSFLFLSNISLLVSKYPAKEMN